VNFYWNVEADVAVSSICENRKRQALG